MRAVVALATAEIGMLARNRTAAFNGLVLPLGFGALFLMTGGPPAGGEGALAALQVIAVLIFSVFSVATTTLVARRQQNVLKRWRSSVASTTAILAGTLAPPALLLTVQAVLLLTATALVTDTRPRAPVLLLVALAAGMLLCSALSFITAAYTRTPETASVTVAPVLGGVFAGAMWTVGTPAAEVTWTMLATGGGAVAHLTRLGWEGVPGGGAFFDPSHVGAAIFAIAALTTLVLIAATKLFRWDPRS